MVHIFNLNFLCLAGHLDTRSGGFEIGMCNRRGYVGYIDDASFFSSQNRLKFTLFLLSCKLLSSSYFSHL